MKLSSLMPIDLTSLREVSMARVRKQLDAGILSPVAIERWPELSRPILADGRHRVLVGMRRGVTALPAILRTYGPRGGLRSTRPITLELDALP